MSLAFTETSSASQPQHHWYLRLGILWRVLFYELRMLSSISIVFLLASCSSPLPSWWSRMSQTVPSVPLGATSAFASSTSLWEPLLWNDLSGPFSFGNLVLPLVLVIFPRKEASTLLSEGFLLGCHCCARWAEEAGGGSQFSGNPGLCVQYVHLGPVSSHPGNPLFCPSQGIHILCLLSDGGDRGTERGRGCNCFMSSSQSDSTFNPLSEHTAPVPTPLGLPLCRTRCFLTFPPLLAQDLAPRVCEISSYLFFCPSF